MKFKKIISAILCGAVLFTGAISLTSCFKGIESDDPVTDDPVTDDPITDDPITDDPVTDDPITDDPITDDPITDDPVTDDPVTDDPVTDDPITDDPITDDPVTDDPITEPVHTHSAAKTEAVDSTCTAEGNIEYWYCAECGKYFSDEACSVEISVEQLKIEKMAHSYYSGYCTVCGEADPDYVPPTPSEGLAYTLSDDGTYYILSGIGTCSDTDIVIPSSYENLPVKEIGSYAFCAYDLESYEALGSNITSITILDGVTAICEGAFYGCTSLKQIEIARSVTTIGDYAFASCGALTSITIPDGATSIGASAFYECSSLSSVKIGSGVKEIGVGAFYLCDALTDITLPDGVKNIGASAFRGCTSLSHINMGGAQSIGELAFGGCVSLPDVAIPASVTDIGKTAFVGCTSLKNITVDGDNKNYKSVDGNLYTKDGTKLVQYAVGSTAASFVVPNGVTEICANAFSSCSSLKNITLPDSLAVIGEYAFAWCSSLTDVVVPDGVTEIGDGAFRNCSALKSVTLGESVESIGEYAFTYCKAITNITIPDSVAHIGASAFYNCVSITGATFKNTSGWTAGSSAVSSDSLSDPSSAATCLISTYCWFTWTRG